MLVHVCFTIVGKKKTQCIKLIICFWIINSNTCLCWKNGGRNRKEKVREKKKARNSTTQVTYIFHVFLWLYLLSPCQHRWQSLLATSCKGGSIIPPVLPQRNLRALSSTQTEKTSERPLGRGKHPSAAAQGLPGCDHIMGAAAGQAAGTSGQQVWLPAMVLWKAYRKAFKVLALSSCSTVSPRAASCLDILSRPP